jgi:hypothetical protein
MNALTLFFPTSTKVGSFFFVQYLGGLLVTVFSVLYSCDNDTYYRMFVLVYLLIGVVGTNILCHVRNKFWVCRARTYACDLFLLSLSPFYLAVSV